MRKIAVLLLATAAFAAAADPSLMSLVMPDARVLSGVNVAQARNSRLGQFLLSQAPPAEASADFQKFVQASGFDPRYQLDEVLIASPGGKQGQTKLVLARGTFDASAIRALAVAAGAQVSAYKGVDLISPPPKKAPEAVALAFLSGSVAAAGDTASVKAAIDRSQGGAPGGPAEALQQKAGLLSAAQEAWFVSTVPVSEISAQIPDQGPNGILKGNALQSISEVSGGIKLGDLVKFTAAVVTGTAEDAKSLADVLKFLAGLAALHSKPGQQMPPFVQSLLGSLTLAASGNVVNVGLSAAAADLEKLIQQGAQAHHHGPPAKL